MNRDKV